MITVKSRAEVEVMARAAVILVDALQAARERIQVGTPTANIDAAVVEVLARAGAKAAFLGYMGYPASSCVSLNAEIVHGIPSPRKIIRDGDLVSVDVGVELEGYFADAAFTVAVGAGSDLGRRLMACGRRCLEAATAQCRAGKRVGDISHAIQRIAEGEGFNVVREYVGHGIGTRMHEEPQVPNAGPPDRGAKLLPGMALALEPMVVAGDWHTRVAKDGWTVSTRDGAPAVHFEHTVIVTDGDAEVLTRGWEAFA